jgi:DHA1 family bicyclomycin/chloramphenicol resistance-like MFS transporter
VNLTPRSPAYIALLVALGSFGPLTMSIYTPVMPSVGHELLATPENVKLTLTTYMLGFAVGQLFYGPLSDRYGRRPVLLGGLLFFTITSFACSFAPSIGGLIGLRILQGLGAASGSVLGRALTRDAYTFKEMPLVMSWISLGQNIAPSLAPMIGGFLGEWSSWRATFWFVGGFGAILFLITLAGLRETNRFRSERIDLSSLMRGSGEMLRDRRFLGHILPLGFAFALNFGMLAGVPFVLQESMGFSPREFGLIVLLSVGGFTLGTFVNNRLVGRVAPVDIIMFSGWFHVAALIGMAALSLAGIQSGDRHRRRTRHRPRLGAGHGGQWRQRRGQRPRRRDHRRRRGRGPGAAGRRRDPRGRRQGRGQHRQRRHPGSANASSTPRSRPSAASTSVVNNAGILRDRIFHNMSVDEWRAVIDVHLNGSFYMARAAAPSSRSRRARCLRAHDLHLGSDRQLRPGQLRGGQAGHHRPVEVDRARHAALQRAFELHLAVRLEPHDRHDPTDTPEQQARVAKIKQMDDRQDRPDRGLPGQRRGQGRHRPDLRACAPTRSS